MTFIKNAITLHKSLSLLLKKGKDEILELEKKCFFFPKTNTSIIFIFSAASQTTFIFNI